jgi:Ca2+-binding EF-hand superfamily protein
MTGRKMFIQAACVAVTLCGVGAMRTQAATLPPSLGTLDPDKDGTVSLAEAKAAADKDGTVDKAEWAALVEQHFKAADRDHDGTLDAKELESPEGKQLLKMLQ